MRVVGENLPRALRQEINILEVMFKDNLLNDFYSRGFGMQRYLVDAARIVSQVSHRFPHQNILEIGMLTALFFSYINKYLEFLNYRCWNRKCHE